MKNIIDVCCGSRMFHFDKNNTDVVYMDNRQVEDTLCDGRMLSYDPYYCGNCGFRADGLVGTIGQGYKYKIEESGETDEIFTPIERVGK